MEKSRKSFSQPNLGRVREIVFSTWELDMKLQGIGLQPPQLCWGSKRHMVSAAWRHPKTSRCTEKRKEVEHFWFFERNENNHTTWKIFVGRSFVFDVGVLFPFFFSFLGALRRYPINQIQVALYTHQGVLILDAGFDRMALQNVWLQNLLGFWLPGRNQKSNLWPVELSETVF